MAGGAGTGESLILAAMGSKLAILWTGLSSSGGLCRLADHMNLALRETLYRCACISKQHATGAMLISTVLDELERRQQRFGLVTLCVGGGMGIATIVERV